MTIIKNETHMIGSTGPSADGEPEEVNRVWFSRLRREAIRPLKINYILMKKIIRTSDAPAAIGPYSQAVEANGTLFISGQIAIDPGSGKIVDGDIKEQTRQVFRNIEAILHAAGYNFDEVVKSTCYLSDIADFKAMNEIYGQIYTENPPARAAFAVKELPLGALIEIETVAVK